MKNVRFLIIVLFYCVRNCVAHPTSTTPTFRTTTHLAKTTYTTNEIIFSTENDGEIEIVVDSSKQGTTSTTISTPSENLDDISIQDILLSDIDASDKIEKKIINAITEFSSQCNINKQVDLSLNEFVFAKNTINLDIGIGNASFYNFFIREESDTSSGNKKKLYSTLIGCDSSKKAKVEVTLPNNIRITARIKVNEIVNLPNGFASNSISEGSLTIILKNNSILKQFTFQNDNLNYEEEIIQKFSYFKTEVFLDMDTKYQKAVYNNLGVFLNEIESSLEQFFVNELTAELTKNRISVGQSCSKFTNMEKTPKPISFLFLKSDLNNLYVISNVSLETWKGAKLSVGPIVIQGLSHFNSTEMIVSGTEILSSIGSNSYYYTTTPRYDDPEKKQITVRIKTNALKGKLDWSYNFKRRTFSFYVDSVIFEVQKNIYQYSHSSSYYSYEYSHRSESERNNINIDVYLGDVQIKSSESSVCENEKEFVNFVLSEYLKTTLKDSLKNSLTEKLQNNFSVVNC